MIDPAPAPAAATRTEDRPASGTAAEAPAPASRLFSPPPAPVSAGVLPPLNPTARVKWLVAASSGQWLAQAIARPDLVLIDHAHCERKAAGAALQLMFRYPAEPGLGERLSPLAREELEHFEQVLGLMARRGLALRPLPAPAYGARLSAAVRRDEPGRMLDSYLVAGLIEARSHERMALLAAHSPDADLRALYGELLASEARHFGLYWTLAEERFGREATVERLEVLAQVEVEALSGELGAPEAVRMHSAGVEGRGLPLAS